MMGKPGATAHPQENFCETEKRGPLWWTQPHGGAHGWMAGSSLRCCIVNNLHNCTC